MSASNKKKKDNYSYTPSKSGVSGSTMVYNPNKDTVKGSALPYNPATDKNNYTKYSTTANSGSPSVNKNSMTGSFMNKSGVKSNKSVSDMLADMKKQTSGTLPTSSPIMDENGMANLSFNGTRGNGTFGNRNTSAAPTYGNMVYDPSEPFSGSTLPYDPKTDKGTYENFSATTGGNATNRSMSGITGPNGSRGMSIYDAAADLRSKASNPYVAPEPTIDENGMANMSRGGAASTTGSAPEYNYNGKPLDVFDYSNAPVPEFNFNEQKPEGFDFSKYELPAFTYNEAKPDAYVAPEYNSTYDAHIQSVVDKILNGEKFNYDINGDAAYQQYKSIYERNAKTAANNAMAQMSANTGGYGNSYASAAAQQGYNQTMQNVASAIPEFEDRAYSRYRDGISDLYNQYNTLGAERANERAIYEDNRNFGYNQYRNDMADYYDNRNFAYNQYRNDVDDSKWTAEFEYNDYRNDVADYYNNREFAYNQYRNDMSDYFNNRNFAADQHQRAIDNAFNDRQQTHLEEQDAWNNNFQNRQQTHLEEQDAWNNNFKDRQQTHLEEQDAWNNDFQNRQQTHIEEQDAWENGFAEQQHADNQAQQAWENDFTKQQYEDNKAQQAWENDFAKQQYNDERADANYEAAWNEAMTAAEYGDFTLLGAMLGVSPEKLASNSKLSTAIQVYNSTGDNTMLKELGIDTSAFDAKDKLSSGLAVYEATGDSSILNSLGIDTTGINPQKLATAIGIYESTGDGSFLRELGIDPSVMDRYTNAKIAATGSSGGSGRVSTGSSSGGGSYSGSSGSSGSSASGSTSSSGSTKVPGTTKMGVGWVNGNTHEGFIADFFDYCNQTRTPIDSSTADNWIKAHVGDYGLPYSPEVKTWILDAVQVLF